MCDAQDEEGGVLSDLLTLPPLPSRSTFSTVNRQQSCSRVAPAHSTADSTADSTVCHQLIIIIMHHWGSGPNPAWFSGAYTPKPWEGSASYYSHHQTLGGSASYYSHHQTAFREESHTTQYRVLPLGGTVVSSWYAPATSDTVST